MALKQLLPALEEAMGPLNEQERRFVKVLGMLKLHLHVDRLGWKGVGRPPNSRLFMARAFAAKAAWNMPTTKSLIGQLQRNTHLRRLCGREDGPGSVPDKSVFSRAFASFAPNCIAHHLRNSPAPIPSLESCKWLPGQFFSRGGWTFSAPPW